MTVYLRALVYPLYTFSKMTKMLVQVDRVPTESVTHHQIPLNVLAIG